MNKHLVGEGKKPTFQGKGRAPLQRMEADRVSGNGEILLYGCSVHRAARTPGIRSSEQGLDRHA